MTTTATHVVDLTNVVAGTVCEFSVTVQNFMSVESSSANVFVTRTDVEEPKLALRSDRAQPWLRNEVSGAVGL